MHIICMCAVIGLRFPWFGIHGFFPSQCFQEFLTSSPSFGAFHGQLTYHITANIPSELLPRDTQMTRRFNVGEFLNLTRIALNQTCSPRRTVTEDGSTAKAEQIFNISYPYLKCSQHKQ